MHLCDCPDSFEHFELKINRLISLSDIFSCLENLKSCSKVLELTGSANYFIPISQKVDF